MTGAFATAAPPAPERKPKKRKANRKARRKPAQRPELKIVKPIWRDESDEAPPAVVTFRRM